MITTRLTCSWNAFSSTLRETEMPPAGSTILTEQPTLDIPPPQTRTSSGGVVSVQTTESRETIFKIRPKGDPGEHAYQSKAKIEIDVEEEDFAFIANAARKDCSQLPRVREPRTSAYNLGKRVAPLGSSAPRLGTKGGGPFPAPPVLPTPPAPEEAIVQNKPLLEEKGLRRSRKTIPAKTKQAEKMNAWSSSSKLVGTNVHQKLVETEPQSPLVPIHEYDDEMERYRRRLMCVNERFIRERGCDMDVDHNGVALAEEKIKNGERRAVEGNEHLWKLYFSVPCFRWQGKCYPDPMMPFPSVLANTDLEFDVDQKALKDAEKVFAFVDKSDSDHDDEAAAQKQLDMKDNQPQNRRSRRSLKNVVESSISQKKDKPTAMGGVRGRALVLKVQRSAAEKDVDDYLENGGEHKKKRGICRRFWSCLCFSRCSERFRPLGFVISYLYIAVAAWLIITYGVSFDKELREVAAKTAKFERIAQSLGAVIVKSADGVSSTLDMPFTMAVAEGLLEDTNTTRLLVGFNTSRTVTVAFSYDSKSYASQAQRWVLSTSAGMTADILINQPLAIFFRVFIAVYCTSIACFTNRLMDIFEAAGL